MKLIKEINKKESGQTFILVLILLLLGGLIIAPLLSYMSTGLNVGQVYEERMDELYAADSGVEDALWKVITKAAGLPTEGTPEGEPYSIDPVNEKDVNPIIITYIDELTYSIESTATNPDTGSSTRIESYLNILDFAFFAENAITSPTSASMYKGDTVNGIIQIPNTPDPEPLGDWYWDSDPVVGWPDETAVQGLRNFYRSQIPDGAPHYYTDTTIDLNNNTPIGPLYVNGDLTLNGKGIGKGDLTGVIYVTGKLDFTNKDLQLEFNNNAIYVEGQGYPAGGPKQSIDMPSGKIALVGPGCLISEQDINFQPNAYSSDFIFVMSINGTVNFQPGGDFIGSIAGKVNVNMQPGKTLTNPYTPEQIENLNLNYPGGLTANNVISKILTWEISLQ